ncbi:hypothetical protein FRC19_003841 [Serendipita sp. 401]|nr:hypothetical protein FRC16_008240 [Serendipita sp. 398]KAG8828502.1 hypothetical protein FRC19_003841 [Serendipita sp. 401]KAG9058626.1 hypothetical protein FS842_008048 [Serendipita sp. 407]
MVKTAIVDDTDPNIVYADGWLAMNQPYSPTTYDFNSTLHYGYINGLTIRYPFRGTGITVYGTISLPCCHGTPGSIYSVDGGTPVRFNTSGEVPYPDPKVSYSHIPFYRSPQLSYGDHEILITIDNVSLEAKRLYYFDFFAVSGVQDSDNAQGSGGGPGFTIVDDTDSRVSYSGEGWSSTSGTPTDFLGTATTSPNDTTAISTFSFTGTSISVYAHAFDNYGKGNVAKFVVDPGTSQEIVRYASILFTTDRRHAPLLILEGLADGEHTIQVTTLTQKKWYLDYFVYGTTGAEFGGLNGTASGIVAEGGSSTPNTGPGTGSGLPTTPSSPQTKTAIIVGAAIGAVAGLLLLVALVVYVLRRKRIKAGELKLEHGDRDAEKNTTTESHVGSRMSREGRRRGGGSDGGTGSTTSTTPLRNHAGVGTRRNNAVTIDGNDELDRAEYPERPSGLAPPLPFPGKSTRRFTRNVRQSTGTFSNSLLNSDGTLRSPVDDPSSIVPITPTHRDSQTQNGGLPYNREGMSLVEEEEEEEGYERRGVASLPSSSGQRPLPAVTNEPMEKAVFSRSQPIQRNSTMQRDNDNDQNRRLPSLPHHHHQQQRAPARVQRQQRQRDQQGLPSVTTGRSEEIGAIGREIDGGVRLDPSQLNLTVPDLLPPSYSATTYR